MVADAALHGFNDTASATMYALLNDAVWDIDSREQWPYLDTTGDLTFAASSPTATSFPPQWSKTVSLVNATTGSILRPKTFDWIRERYTTELTEEGEPIWYYFVGNIMNIYPEPSTQTTFKHAYTRWQTELTSVSTETDVLMPSRHHRIIVFHMLENLFAMEDDLEMSSYFNKKFEERYARMLMDFSTLHFDIPPIVEYDDDDWY